MNAKILSEEAQEIFTRIRSEASPLELADIEALWDEIVSRAPRWAKSGDYEEPAIQAERMFRQLPSAQARKQGDFSRALFSDFALKVPKLLKTIDLPESVLAYYPATIDRMALDLESSVEQPKGQVRRLFSTYTRLVLAMTVPCGAEVVDLVSNVPVRSAVASSVRTRSWRTLTRYLKCQGLGVWFRTHTDVNYLDEFNEAGWDRYYLRVAELLSARSRVRGLVGTSWFYDPQLLQISPRLAYLQERPCSRGAFLMRHRSSEYDIAQATKASAARRQLYEKGDYVPVSHTLLWGRNELLSWAKSVGGSRPNPKPSQ